MNKIVLLDSNSLINKAFYAIPPLTNKKGIVTNAVFGYLNMLAKLILEHKPTHIAAVFDLRAPTFRHKKFDYYKATRKGMPDDLASQLPLLKEIIVKMGIKILELEGYEADDIIGTIAKRFDSSTIIVSGDKDVLQLVDDSTVVFHSKRGVSDIKIYDIDTLKEEGLTPQLVIEYKGLAGDSSDNIHGASGVGEKTAMALLAQYGSIDGVYENVENLKGKLKENLLRDKQQVLDSKELATICINVPITCTLKDLEFNDVLPLSVKDSLIDLEFKSLITRFNFDDKAIAKTLEIILPEVYKSENICNIQELKSLLNKPSDFISIVLDKDIYVAIDTETEYKVSCSQTLIDDGINYEDALNLIFSSIKNRTLIMFDIKSTMHNLIDYGLDLTSSYDDIQLMSYILNSNFIFRNYKELIEHYSFNTDYPALSIIRLYNILNKQLLDNNQMSLYRDLELPLVRVLFDMEMSGFGIDITVLDELSNRYSLEIAGILEQIYSIVGYNFNINSNQQLSKVLYEDLGLASSKKTKTGLSVAADILEELEHPVINLILRYRTIAKLKSTYLEGMRSLINKGTGKVNTVFKQSLTATGRLSSTEPNLQNIPIRDVEGRALRKMFVAAPNYQLVTADYSQIELRLLAHFSKDESLVKAYKENKDIHSLTASNIYNIPLIEVTKEMRSSAKAVNFGIIYGISAFGLAKNINTSASKAKMFVEKYFERYPKVKEFMNSNIDLTRKQGYIASLLNRRRYFPDINSNNFNIKSFNERAAMNMPLQGTASDIIKIAMLKVHNSLKEKNLSSRMILQVHDELIIEAKDTEVEEVKTLLKECMQDAVKLDVPLLVEVSIGKNWFDAK